MVALALSIPNISDNNILYTREYQLTESTFPPMQSRPLHSLSLCSPRASLTPGTRQTTLAFRSVLVMSSTRRERHTGRPTMFS